MSSVSAWSKVSGTWRQQGFTAVKVSGQWRTIARSFVKVNGVWRTAGLGVPPPKPNIVWHSTGQFRITNYNSSFNYQTRYATGPGGTPSLNQSTGIYSVPAQSGFFVSAAYAAGAPRSTEGYMERRRHEIACRGVSYTECFGCNCGLQGGNCFCAPGPCDGGCPPNGQCGCGGSFPCTCGSIGEVVCQTCCETRCCNTVCDVFVTFPGYTNSGTEWYKVG